MSSLTRTKARYWLSRWPVASLLNRSTRTCWAELVGWALGDKTSLSGGAYCRAESKTHRDKSCYCAKFTDGCLTAKAPAPAAAAAVVDPTDRTAA